MEITETQEGGKGVAILDGRLDTATAALTETRLLAMLEKGGVIADLSEVRYVSSAGLRVLLKTCHSAGAARPAGPSLLFAPCLRLRRGAAAQ